MSALALPTPLARGMTTAHAQESIRTGQQAWKAIKATAEEQRTLWLAVGEALMYGRLENPSNQAFGKWCVTAGFDMDRRVRADAMWFAENYAVVQSLDNDGLSHPTAIRAAFNTHVDTQALPIDLQETPAPVPTAQLPKATAVKVNKLVHRSTTNDEGSETAARHLKAFARQHGIDLDGRAPSK